MLRAADVASYQPRDLGELIQQYQLEHVVARLYLPEEQISQDHSRAQIQSVMASGGSVGCYMWCYRSLSPRKSVRDAVALVRSCGVEPPMLWLDVEPYPDGDELPDVPWLWEAIDTCWRLGMRPGIYSGKWLWPQMGNTTVFAEAGIPLWAAQHDGIADPDVFTPFGGWRTCASKQYAVIEVRPGLKLDLDVFRAEVA